MKELEQEKVDLKAKEFFNYFNTNISVVSEQTNLKRHTFYRFVEYRTNEKNTKKIVECLEDTNARNYRYEVSSCVSEVKHAINRLNQAWNDYERKERILNTYRCKYGIQRKGELLRKITLKEMLKKAMQFP